MKSNEAKRLYGVEIPPGRFKKEIVVGQGFLTLKQYRDLQEEIYGTMELGLLMKEVEGVVDYVQRLASEGHILTIITSRGVRESEVAKGWMRKIKLNLPLIGVGGEVKTDACRGLDVYIDDDFDKLEPLIGVVPHRFLFSREYNRHINVPASVARRVDSWQQFYQEIRLLNS